MGLIEELGAGPVGLDTVVFIYFVEEHPDYLRIVEPLFQAIDQGKIEATTSTLTLLETLVVPLRAGREDLATRYETLLVRGRGLRMVELDRDLLRAAAGLRARFGVRTPDAIQLAAALVSGCQILLTNDRRLPELPGLRILQLRDFLSAREAPPARRPPR